MRLHQIFAEENYSPMVNGPSDDDPRQLVFPFLDDEDSSEQALTYKHPRRIAQILLRDCESFFSRNGKRLMYRGVDSFLPTFQATIRLDRKLKDTSSELNDLINNVLKEKGFRVNRINCLFVSGSKNTSEGYGESYCIFPVHDFDFVWSSEIADAYMDFSDSGEYHHSYSYDDALREYHHDLAHYRARLARHKQEKEDYDKEMQLYYDMLRDWANMDDEERTDMEEPDKPIPPDEFDEPMPNPPDEPDHSMDYDRIAETVHDTYRQNDDLAKALQSNHEIMIGSSNPYYAVKTDFFHSHVLPYMKGMVEITATISPKIKSSEHIDV